MAVFRKKLPPRGISSRETRSVSSGIWRISSAAFRTRLRRSRSGRSSAALVHARLADQYRDVGLAPLDASDFDRLASSLDGEGWRRLALAVLTLDDAELRPALSTLAPRVPVAVQVKNGLLGLALETAPLTVDLVRQSAVRAEEFARQLAMRLGVAIVGETEAQSLARANALDYKRLLAEAELAKAAAHEKMERLRQRQAEADGRRRRGKW